MKRNQDVRKYSRLKYALLHGRYAVLSSLYVSVSLLIVSGAMLFITIAALSALVTAIGLVFLVFSVCGFFIDCVPFTVASSLVTLVSGTGAFVLLRILRYTETRPDGHFLKPLPPEANEILPDKEVLVRASMAGNTEAAEELLRATLSPTETPAEELLRASTENNGR